MEDVKTTDERVAQMWSDYQSGIAYLGTKKLTKNIPLFIKFYEGEQWPAATPETRNLPRPVINIIKMIVRNKKAGVLSSPVVINYTAEDESTKVEKFNRFSNYIRKEMKDDELDSRAVDDGSKKGSYCNHYYWDSEAKGKKGIREGGLRGEIVDPLNVIFANPNETDEQKQKWIMIVSRVDVEAAKKMCENKSDANLITGDSNDSAYHETEQEGTSYCTVLTRYFKKDGEVYFEKATKSVCIQKPIPLTPNIEEAKRKLFKEDEANNALPDKPTTKKKQTNRVVADMYPIAFSSWQERDKCIYGIGEIEESIPNQKSINFTLAMQLLQAQNVGWGKWVVSKDALGSQKINNEPGQVLIDYSAAGNGIKRVTEQDMSGVPITVINTLVDLTRVSTGATEVMTGETLGKNQSGAAIAQLQSQALKPIEELQQSFFRHKEKCGKILEMFYKLFYQEKEFSYKTKDEATGKEITKKDVFSGRDYEDTEFACVAEAGAGTAFSDVGDINFLENSLQKGLISFKTAVECYPKNTLSNRQKILECIEQEEKSQILQLQTQLAQTQDQLAQAATIIQKQTEAVNNAQSIVQENRRLKEELLKLQSEYTNKIMQANGKLQQSRMREEIARQDATEFAQKIYQDAMQKPQKSLVTQSINNGGGVK